MLHAELLKRHVRERAVTSQAAREQSEGLNVLELGTRQVELTDVDSSRETEIVAEGDT